MNDDAMTALLNAGAGDVDLRASAVQREVMTFTVKTKHEELIRAASLGDADRAAAVLHSDFISINTDGTITTRAQELANINPNKSAIELNVIEKFEVHPIGSNMAIATGVARTKGTFEGKDVSGTYTFRQVWATNSPMMMMACFNGTFARE